MDPEKESIERRYREMAKRLNEYPEPRPHVDNECAIGVDGLEWWGE